MSNADLSLEISSLVTRSVSGEHIDVDGEADRLAAKFPGLGVSGDLIGKAIRRAVGMVDEINASAPEIRASSAMESRKAGSASDLIRVHMPSPQRFEADGPVVDGSTLLSLEEQLSVAFAAEFAPSSARQAETEAALADAGGMIPKASGAVRPFPAASMASSRIQGRIAAARRTFFGR